VHNDFLEIYLFQSYIILLLNLNRCGNKGGNKKEDKCSDKRGRKHKKGVSTILLIHLFTRLLNNIRRRVVIP
jgi:hypothetical protein